LYGEEEEGWGNGGERKLLVAGKRVCGREFDETQERKEALTVYLNSMREK
jgi:hypothetical protein